MPVGKPTLRARQIADLMTMLTGVPFTGEVVRCWTKHEQWRLENWADLHIHGQVICDRYGWPVGRPAKLPDRALSYIETRGAYQRIKLFVQKARYERRTA